MIKYKTQEIQFESQFIKLNYHEHEAVKHSPLSSTTICIYYLIKNIFSENTGAYFSRVTTINYSSIGSLVSKMKPESDHGSWNHGWIITILIR